MPDGTAPLRSLYAIGDIHGFRAEAVRALQTAGLIDQEEQWLAREATLVVMGDTIDRGPDSKGVVELLLRLSGEAAERDSSLVCLLGNHEAMMLMAPKYPAAGALWLDVGGRECLRSYGIAAGAIYEANFTHALVQAHPDYYLALHSHHIESDTLFVHAGVPPNRRLEDLSVTQDHLWIEPRDFIRTTSADLRERFGVARVVFGHHPYLGGVTSFQQGAFLGVDTGSFLAGGYVSVVEILPDLAFRVAGRS